MSSQAPAVWSAIAASFAAISAGLSWRVQKQSLAAEARPEIVLDKWERNSDDCISFGVIKNVGRGTALHLNMNSKWDRNEDGPTQVMATFRATSLAKGETIEDRTHIKIFWKNVPQIRDENRYVTVVLTILCWDNEGYRHETTYFLAVCESEEGVAMDEVAPGVMLRSRATSVTPVWRLKMQKRISSYKRQIINTFKRIRSKGASIDSDKEE